MLLEETSELELNWLDEDTSEDELSTELLPIGDELDERNSLRLLEGENSLEDDSILLLENSDEELRSLDDEMTLLALTSLLEETTLEELLSLIELLRTTLLEEIMDSDESDDGTVITSSCVTPPVCTQSLSSQRQKSPSAGVVLLYSGRFR